MTPRRMPREERSFIIYLLCPGISICSHLVEEMKRRSCGAVLIWHLLCSRAMRAPAAARLQVSLLCDVFEPHVAIAFCKCNIHRELRSLMQTARLQLIGGPPQSDGGIVPSGRAGKLEGGARSSRRSRANGAVSAPAAVHLRAAKPRSRGTTRSQLRRRAAAGGDGGGQARCQP